MSPDPTVDGAQIFTASGAVYDLADPSTWDRSVRSISQGLANTCRFGGQVPRFYSVAEHSVLVARLIADKGGDPVERLAGLLHDAHEAFYGDIVRPMKPLVGPLVLDLMRRFDRVIEEALGLPEGLMESPIVKEADNHALRLEAGVLWAESPPAWAIPATASTRAAVQCMAPQPAELLFQAELERLIELSRDGRSS